MDSPTSPARSAAPPAAPPRVAILMVDDEPKNLTTLDAVLESDDRTLVHASSGPEALRKLLQEDFALILLDVHMPGMDGFDTAQLVRERERSRDTPIIFLTAASKSEAFVSRGYSVGAVDYLLKPFDPVMLRQKVAVFVDLFKKSEQIKRQADERVQLLEERAARAEAEAARDRLQQVIDVLPEGIVLADEHSRPILWNRTALDILGHATPPLDHADNGLLGVLHLDGVPCPLEDLPLSRAIRHGEVVRGEQLLVPNAVTGKQIPVLMNSAPLRDADGTIVGGVAAFQDITPIKELEQQKDDFLAAASHDLKSPITAMKARAQLLHRQLSRGKPDLPRVLQGLHGIDETASRLTAMINELLDTTRIKMGRPLDLDREPMDLVALANKVASDLQYATERHEIRVESSSPDLIGEWDRPRLERVLTNLVANAVKFSPDGGAVTISVTREGRDDHPRDDGADWAALRVRDEGVGIPTEELPRIFERFYRASNVAHKIEGTGIGLTGSRQIVEEHAGRIMVESEEHAGTTVTLLLPLTTLDPSVFLAVSDVPATSA